MYVVKAFVIDADNEEEYGQFVYQDAAEQCVIALAKNKNIAGARIVPVQQVDSAETKKS